MNFMASREKEFMKERMECSRVEKVVAVHVRKGTLLNSMNF
jgi:hypothetical protein